MAGPGRRRGRGTGSATAETSYQPGRRHDDADPTGRTRRDGWICGDWSLTPRGAGRTMGAWRPERGDRAYPGVQSLDVNRPVRGVRRGAASGRAVAPTGGYEGPLVAPRPAPVTSERGCPLTAGRSGRGAPDRHAPPARWRRGGRPPDGRRTSSTVRRTAPRARSGGHRVSGPSCREAGLLAGGGHDTLGPARNWAADYPAVTVEPTRSTCGRRRSGRARVSRPGSIWRSPSWRRPRDRRRQLIAGGWCVPPPSRRQSRSHPRWVRRDPLADPCQPSPGEADPGDEPRGRTRRRGPPCPTPLRRVFAAEVGRPRAGCRTVRTEAARRELDRGRHPRRHRRPLRLRHRQTLRPDVPPPAPHQSGRLPARFARHRPPGVP